MNSAYRDTLEGLRVRYEARRDDAESLEREVHVSFWDAAAPDLVAEIDALRTAALADPDAADAADELHRAEEAVQAVELLALLRAVDWAVRYGAGDAGDASAKGQPT